MNKNTYANTNICKYIYIYILYINIYMQYVHLKKYATYLCTRTYVNQVNQAKSDIVIRDLMQWAIIFIFYKLTHT